VTVTEAQLAEQLAYYRARAPEYDEWWFQGNAFDNGPGDNEVWFSDARTALLALQELDLGEKATGRKRQAPS
jgi:hypothetical protein